MNTYNSFNELATGQSTQPMTSQMSVFNAASPEDITALHTVIDSFYENLNPLYSRLASDDIELYKAVVALNPALNHITDLLFKREGKENPYGRSIA